MPYWKNSFSALDYNSLPLWTVPSHGLTKFNTRKTWPDYFNKNPFAIGSLGSMQKVCTPVICAVPSTWGMTAS